MTIGHLYIKRHFTPTEFYNIKLKMIIIREILFVIYRKLIVWSVSEFGGLCSVKSQNVLGLVNKCAWPICCCLCCRGIRMKCCCSVNWSSRIGSCCESFKGRRFWIYFNSWTFWTHKNSKIAKLFLVQKYSCSLQILTLNLTLNKIQFH